MAKKVWLVLLLGAWTLRAQEVQPVAPVVEDQVTVPQDLNEISDSVMPQDEPDVIDESDSDEVVESSQPEPEKTTAPAEVVASTNAQPVPEQTVAPAVPAKVDESAQPKQEVVQEQKELSIVPVTNEQPKPAEVEIKPAIATIPAKPAAPEEPTSCKREQVELELTPPECVPSALDTTDIDAQGNWVIKRAFWEQAEKAYEKIMKVNNTLYEQQAQFVQARNDADKLSDGALRELGFEQGQIKEFINGLIESIKQQREQKDLNEEGRKLLQELKERQNELEQLSVRLKALDDLSDTLDKVLSTMTEQVTLCRNYEKQAWDNFKKIGKELNDKKARVLFYEIDGFLRNAQQTRDYVTQTLWQYMQDTVAQISKVLEELKASSSRLQTKGVDIRKQLQEYVALQKNKELLEKQSQTQAALDTAQRAAAECNKELSQGLWGTIKRSTASVWHSITDSASRGWRWLKGLVGA